MADFHRNLVLRVLERERTLGTRLFTSLLLAYFLIKLLICSISISFNYIREKNKLFKASG